MMMTRTARLARALLPAAALVALAACGGVTSAVTSPDSAPTAAQSASGKTGKTTAKKTTLTAEQQDAVGAAKDYLDTMGFSKKGLIKQLSAEAGSGFKEKDAKIAVESMDVDWNAQAVKAAKNYRESGMHFSRDGLVKQLEADAGSGFTHGQAVYGADHSR
jgi:hypothetical protein